MKSSTALMALVLLAVGGTPGWAVEREGSKSEDLAARKPPPPSKVSVVALPFSASNERQSEQARGCVMMNVLRHSFSLAPSGEKSVVGVARRIDRALKETAEKDPGARLKLEEAVRVGKVLGAQWVIYGEVEDLRTEASRSMLRLRKVGTIEIRLVVADVASGEILYWSRVEDTGSGGGGILKAKASTVERSLLTRTINRIFDDMVTALPEHYVGPEVTQEEVRQFVEAMGR